VPVVLQAVWIATPGAEQAVQDALRELAEHSRGEPGNLAYIPYRDPDDPTYFGILEVYADEEARDAHLNSPHFRELALGIAIPLLAERRRHSYHTLD
jgi:(4S)-4-hydroxy-5-phosphonooxypentane-2,3-dione isomerase